MLFQDLVILFINFLSFRMTEFYPYFVSPAVPTEEINHTF